MPHDESYLTLQLDLSECERLILIEMEWLDDKDFDNPEAVALALRSQLRDVKLPSVSAQRAWLTSYATTGVWLKAWGPKPNERGCRLSRNVIDEFNAGGGKVSLNPTTTRSHGRSVTQAIASATRPPDLSEAVLRSRLQSFMGGTRWARTWGPAPGEADCEIPRDLIVEVCGSDKPTPRVLRRY